MTVHNRFRSALRKLQPIFDAIVHVIVGVTMAAGLGFLGLGVSWTLWKMRFPGRPSGEFNLSEWGYYIGLAVTTGGPGLAAGLAGIGLLHRVSLPLVELIGISIALAAPLLVLMRLFPNWTLLLWSALIGLILAAASGLAAWKRRRSDISAAGLP